MQKHITGLWQNFLGLTLEITADVERMGCWQIACKKSRIFRGEFKEAGTGVDD